MVSTWALPGLHLFGKAFLLDLSEKRIFGEARIPRHKWTAPKHQIYLKKKSRAGGHQQKRQKRPFCCVLLLYFFGCAVITPDWTWAWFLHLSKLPTLFRGFTSLHLKVSLKSGRVHSPNQLITAGGHTHHSKLKTWRVDSEFLMAEAPPDSQAGFTADDSDLFFTKLLGNKRQSTQQDGSGPTKQ